MPVALMWGVGPATEARLAKIGVSRPHRRATPRDIAGGPDDHRPRALRRFAIGHSLAHAVSADFCNEGSR
jgi:hypothetical protein